MPKKPKRDQTPNQIALAKAVRQAKGATEEERVERFVAICAEHGVPAPTRELRFHPTRRWRFDLSWPEYGVALEVEGGVFVKGGGRHNRGAGFLKDLEKYNAAALLGWAVLRCVPSKLAKPATVRMVRDMIAARTHPQQEAA